MSATVRFTIPPPLVAARGDGVPRLRNFGDISGRGERRAGRFLKFLEKRKFFGTSEHRKPVYRERCNVIDSNETQIPLTTLSGNNVIAFSRERS